MMPAGFELFRETFGGDVKRYRNARIEVTVRRYDDGPDVVTAKTIEEGTESLCIAQSADGVLITAELKDDMFAMTPESIDWLIEKLHVTKKDIMDVKAFYAYLYPDATFSGR